MNPLLLEAIKNEDWIKSIYQELHKIPEMGLQEFKTKQKILNYLKEIGISYTTFKEHTAIVAEIFNPNNEITIALRSDIDALPIGEDNNLSFKSQHSKMMHACGHDAHTAILLGACKILYEKRESLSVNVKLFFQPAEETVGGAQRMIDDGCMNNPKVDYIFGLHVAPLLECGTIELKYDTFNASTDTLTIKIIGKNAHGAYPHHGIDAIVTSAHVVSALQTLVSRNIDPINSLVLTIGTINGGVRPNIICDEVTLSATLRTLNEETRTYAQNRIKQLIQSVCTGFGADFEITIERGYDALVNDNNMVDLIYKNASELIEKEHISIKKNPSLGAEDFSFFLNHAQGAFYNLGCGNTEKGYTAAIHTPQFKVDQDCLKIGVALQLANVLSFNK